MPGGNRRDLRGIHQASSRLRPRHLPVIPTSTPFDNLVGLIYYRMTESRPTGLNEQEIANLAKNDAEGKVREICFQPLKKFDEKELLYGKSFWYDFTSRSLFKRFTRGRVSKRTF